MWRAMVLDGAGEGARAPTTFFRKKPITFAALSCRSGVKTARCATREDGSLQPGGVVRNRGGLRARLRRRGALDGRKSMNMGLWPSAIENTDCSLPTGRRADSGAEQRTAVGANACLVGRTMFQAVTTRNAMKTKQTRSSMFNVGSWMLNVRRAPSPIFHLPSPISILFLPLLLLLLALPAVVQAQFTCTTNNGTITITGYTGSGGAVTIPDKINGLLVTSIGGYAFWGCTSLTTITIPNSVTSIGEVAFCYCTRLTAITVSAANSAYSSVDGVLFDKSQTALIQYPADKAGSQYTIPNTVTRILDEAFLYCYSLTSVTIGNRVTSIGDEAFFGCSSLTNITIPNSVTNIGHSAFAYCYGLTSVTIPDSVTSIGGGAFFTCYSLTAITVDTNNPVYSSTGGVLFDKSQTTLIQCPQGKAGSYTIPNSVTNIGDSAFASFASCGLTSVTIPDSVTSIGDYAFADLSLRGVYFKGNAPSLGLDVFYSDNNAISYYLPGTIGWGPTFGGCSTGLWDPPTQIGYTTNGNTITIKGYAGISGALTIPDSLNGLAVTSIGDSALSFCTSLTNITIPDSVTSIGDWAFWGCYSLTAITVDFSNTIYSSMGGVLFDKSQVTLIQCPEGKAGSYTIPNTVTNIGDWAFYDCASLSSVVIPSSVTSIGSWAFRGCTSLTDVTIPSSVTSIGEHAFASCYSLTSITISDSVTSIGWGALASCTGLTNATIGNSVTSIGDEAFYYCTSPASVTIGTNVTSIGDGAFYGCTSLTSVTIPNSVTSIEGFMDGAFSGCTSLTNVTIPDSVTSIGSWAFRGCTSLTDVTIGTSVTRIAGGALWGCTSLTSITVDTNNPVYSSVAGVLFDKSQTTLVQCPGGKAGSYKIPNSVTNISDSAFASCGLTSVTIPDSVTSIGDLAFGGCTSLTSVYFKGNSPSLDGDVFGGDNNATIYYLPGTTGWGTTFGVRPTALWFLPNPVILNNGPSFGAQTNRFGFTISWATNIPVVVEASTSLVNPTWSPLRTNTLSGGSAYFSDPAWTNYPTRFYRLRSQ